MKKSAWRIISVLLLGGAALWRYQLAPDWTQRLAPGWQWESTYIGIQALPDVTTGAFPQKDTTSIYTHKMEVVDETTRPHAIHVQDSYVILDPSTGKKTWEYIYSARVDPRTGAHLQPAYQGDVWVFPRWVEKKTYSLRYSYLKGVPLQFQQEDEVEGLRTYVFSYKGRGEYTESYGGTQDYPGVPIAPGQEVRCADDQFSFIVWVEPVSGEIVQLEEGCASGDYLYESATGRQLAPVLRWSGTTAGDDVLQRVAWTRRERTRLLALSVYAPLSLCAAGVLSLFCGLIPRRTPRLTMSQWRSSLATKLLAYQILGFSIILAVLAVLQYRNIRSRMYEEVEQAGLSVGQTFQELLTEHPDLFSPEALEPIVLRFTTKLTNFSRVRVVDYDGQVIADSHHMMVGTQTSQRLIAPLLRGQGQTSSFYWEDGRQYLQVSSLLTGPYDPVRKSTTMGAVMLTLHLANAEQKIRTGFAQVMFITVALLLGFWGLQYYTIRHGLLRWLHMLTFATERFGTGEFSIRATVQTQDEIGKLAETFNRMATEIQNSSEALQSEIAERKQTELALRESDTRYRDLFGNASDIIMTLSLDGTILKANRALEELMGWSLEEVVGQHVGILLTPPSLVLVEENICQAQTTKHAFPTIELEGKCKGGSLILVEVRARLLYDREGNPTAFEGLCRDITARKRAEEALQSAQAAEEANRLKSDFLATMSHELRTPMNGVLGMLGLLLDTNLDETQQGFAETARNSGYALLTILNDILDFSKIEAGKLEIEPVPFDLRLVAEELADTFAAKAEDKGLELIVRYTPDAPRHVVGDSGRIRQVMTNLIGNAVKFTEQGYVIFSIECAGQNMDITRLRFTVEDTGIGIPADKLGYIFDRFTQADASTTRRFGGTGLGLAISKRLIELMGGAIGVTSQPGTGSTFWVELSLPVSTAASQALLPATDLRDVRVLVVDDNEVSREVLHEYLMSWGMRNGNFATGVDALTVMHQAHAAGDPYQVALIDYGMPTVDGATLGRAIKADPTLRETMLVLLTAWHQQGQGEQLTQDGFAAAIHKPVRPSRLFDVLVDCWSAQGRGGKPLTSLCSARGATGASEEKALVLAAPSFPVRVLLVEDNIVNQKVARFMLQRLDCQIDVAANGKEAVAMVEKTLYDVVFMDCQMPEMDGFEATMQIRRGETGSRHLPIVAMTANAMKGDRERCLQAGMDDYLSKPVQKGELVTMLKRWAPATAQLGQHP